MVARGVSIVLLFFARARDLSIEWPPCPCSCSCMVLTFGAALSRWPEHPQLNWLATLRKVNHLKDLVSVRYRVNRGSRSNTAVAKKRVPRPLL